MALHVWGLFEVRHWNGRPWLSAGAYAARGAGVLVVGSPVAKV